ncbi:hypothetical protein BDV96DRAFT_667274 [Lophiotrema nucula]|uniref:Uncharacterized protein n=1 Tax=Lophiotrema nucula TaxID=690887 RepID=A0A6A5YT20_9PLEO|nr:hypothetical protein BDV96DRAFT_667274 [Lophiotrema nucula]
MIDTRTPCQRKCISSTTMASSSKSPMSTNTAELQPCQIQQQGDFFNKLSRDVRLVIYDHLYPYLPPLLHFNKSVDCRGMILSCKQAHQEMVEAAGRHLITFFANFAAEFQKKHDVSISLHKSIPLYQGFAALRDVTLSVPWSCFKFQIDSDRRPAVYFLEDKWGSIIHRHFDKLTLYVHGDNAPPHTTEEERTRVFRTFKFYLFEFAYIIKSGALDNIDHWTSEYVEPNLGDFPNRRHYTKMEAFHFDLVHWRRAQAKRQEIRYRLEEQHGYPRLPVRTNHICIAWNLLGPGEMTPQRLTGKKLKYTWQHVDKLRETDMLRLRSYDNVWPHRYEVTGAEGLVGEVGLAHPDRWELATGEADGEESFIHDMKEVVDVYTTGIGEKLVPVWVDEDGEVYEEWESDPQDESEDESEYWANFEEEWGDYRPEWYDGYQEVSSDLEDEENEDDFFQRG